MLAMQKKKVMYGRTRQVLHTTNQLVDIEKCEYRKKSKQTLAMEVLQFVHETSTLNIFL